MKVGVPGEFHEDQWQRTEEDSERHVIPRTREASGPSDTSYRVAKRSSDRSSARLPCTQIVQMHPRVAKRAFVKAKGAVLGNIKCDEEGACLQLGCRVSSLFL